MYLKTGAAILRGLEGHQDEMREIEASLAAQMGSKHAVFVNQARVGLYLLAKASFRPDRPKVVCSPYTIHDVINMLIAAGWQPVFCDIELETLNIDLNLAADLIREDEEIGAVLVTHLHGAACDIAPIRDLCGQRDIQILEDTAQATGAKVGDINAGVQGTAGVLSFGLMKSVNSLYGGLVVTSSDALAAQVRDSQKEWPVISRQKLMNRLAQGIVLNMATAPVVFDLVTYRAFRTSFIKGVGPINRLSQSENSPVLRTEFPDHYAVRPSLAQAVAAKQQFESVDAHAQVRISTASLYHAALKDVDQVVLPDMVSDKSHVYMQFPMVVPDRHDFISYLLKADCDLAGQHLKNCAALPCFENWAADCPNAAYAEKHVVLLPTYPRFRDVGARKIAEAARRYFAETRK